MISLALSKFCVEIFLPYDSSGLHAYFLIADMKAVCINFLYSLQMKFTVTVVSLILICASCLFLTPDGNIM